MAVYAGSLTTTPTTVISESSVLTGMIFSNISGAARTVSVANGSGDGDIKLEKIGVAANSTVAITLGEGASAISFPSGIYASASAVGVNATVTYI